MLMTSGPLVSLVMPMHNEENNIGPLLREVFRVFDTMVRKPYEIIIVDDASEDRGDAVVDEENKRYAAGGMGSFLTGISILKLPVRSGQFRALLRGMTEASGEYILTMDSDLQYDPADIPALIRKLDSFDLVCGIRSARHDALMRRICSKVANGFRNFITGDSTSDSGCMFRVMRASCLAAILPCDGRLFGCEGLFFPLLIRKKGFRVGETPVSHRKRGFGKSRYRLIRGRMLSGIAACLRIRFGGLAQ
jgi:dolichol-phosphate mannosyltransferase